MGNTPSNRVDWSAIGALAGVGGFIAVLGGATVTAAKSRATNPKNVKNVAKRLDNLDIRLFGLPADAESGAKKLPGEFDRIDQRLDELPGAIIAELRK